MGGNMITITVTQENINNGQVKCNDTCPVALSFKGHKDIAHVGIFDKHSHLFLKKKIKGRTIMLDFDHSKELLNFIKEFDSGEKVSPASFVFSRKDLRRKVLL